MLSMLRLELPCMTAADSESKGHCCMRNRPWQELSISARGVLDEDGSPAVGVGPLMSCPISQVTLPHDCETPHPSPRPPPPPPHPQQLCTYIHQSSPPSLPDPLCPPLTASVLMHSYACIIQALCIKTVACSMHLCLSACCKFTLCKVFTTAVAEYCVMLASYRHLPPTHFCIVHGSHSTHYNFLR